MKTRKNNKGFSLVELIVVVAIMAVLVGILAPAYLKYVENSRQNKDETNAEEFRHAVEVALSEETVYNTISFGTGGTDDIVIKITDIPANAAAGAVSSITPATATSGNGALVAEMIKIAGNKLDFTSKEYQNDVLTITVDAETLKVTSSIAAPAPAGG